MNSQLTHWAKWEWIDYKLSTNSQFACQVRPPLPPVIGPRPQCLYLRTGARNATGNKGIPDPKHCDEENTWNQPPRTEGRKETEPQRIKEEKSSRTNYYQVRMTEQVDAIICDRTENGTELIDAERENAAGNDEHNSNGWKAGIGLREGTWRGPGASKQAWLEAAARSESESRVGNDRTRRQKERRGRQSRLETQAEWMVNGNGAETWERDRYTGGEGPWKPVITSWTHCRHWVKLPSMCSPNTFRVLL